jgi:ankyrin repeat protein
MGNETVDKVPAECQPFNGPHIPPLELHDKQAFKEYLAQHLDKINTPLENSLPLLLVACQANNADAARLLLEYGANPNFVSAPMATSPMICACTLGLLIIVDLLVQHKADVNLEVHGVSPLVAAVMHGHVGVTMRLLAANANVNHGKYPWHVAASVLSPFFSLLPCFLVLCPCH